MINAAALRMDIRSIGIRKDRESEKPFGAVWVHDMYGFPEPVQKAQRRSPQLCLNTHGSGSRLRV